MAFKMDVEVSVDRKEARVDFLTRRMRLDVAEMDSIIATLAQARAYMTPAHEDRRPPAGVNLDADNMHWFVGPHPSMSGHVRIGLRHPGFGWVTAPLTLVGTEQLEAQLQRTRAAVAEAPVVTQTATISRLPSL
jgi:hypothetical protein